MKEMLQANARSLLLTVLILSNSAVALAFYHPEEGRWLSRDPVTEYGFLVATHRMMRFSPPPPRIDFLQRSMKACSDIQGIRCPYNLLFEIWLSQYQFQVLEFINDVNKMQTRTDVYSFVMNHPVDAVDADGLACYTKKDVPAWVPDSIKKQMPDLHFKLCGMDCYGGLLIEKTGDEENAPTAKGGCVKCYF